MFIRSERLFLRPGWPEDAEDLHANLQDRQVVRNLAQVPWPFDLQHARDYTAVQGQPRFPRFLVTAPGDRGARLIGGAEIARAGDGARASLWIGRDHCGQGYGTEAGRAIVSLARAIGHTRLDALPFIDSPASGRVLEKLGFRRTGRIVERYSQSRKMAYPAREYVMDLAGSETAAERRRTAAKDDSGGLCAA